MLISPKPDHPGV